MSISLATHDNLDLPKSAFGELLTVELSPHAGWRFDYGVISALYSTTGTANSGAVTVDSSRAKLSTSTNTAGIARISTLRRLRYLPGFGGLVRFTAIFATGTASSQQIIGIGDTNDGFFFGYNGTSFGVMRRRNGSDTWTAQASFNGNSLSEALDTTFGNIYQIRYQWLGYGLIRFYIFDKNKEDFVLVHTIKYPNTTADVSILNPTLPLMAEIKNTGNNTNLIMYSPSALGATEGYTEQVSNPLDVARGEGANGSFNNTNNNHAFTIRNKTTAFAGSLTNRVPIRVRNISIGRGTSSVDASTFRIYKNATFAGALTYTDIDANDSPVEYSSTTTTISTGNIEYNFQLMSGGASVFAEFNQGILIYPGETLTIAVQNSSATTTFWAAAFNWDELF